MTQHETAAAAPNYSEAFARIRELPGDAVRDGELTRLAEPLCALPSAGMRGYVRLPRHNGFEKVPFTEPELQAIRQADQARQELALIGAQTSGPAREFILHSWLFPRKVEAFRFRREAVLGIVVTAFAAYDALVRDAGTAWEPLGKEAELFAVVRDLPANLETHTILPA